MDEVLFHLSRHLETLQIHLQWGLQQTRQTSIAWTSSARQQLGAVQAWPWGDNLRHCASVLTAAFTRASTVLAQPTEVYNQIYELIRIEMPIMYPGGAGFLTGAVLGVIIGLSFQRTLIPVQKMKAVGCMSYDGLDSLTCMEEMTVPSVLQKNQVLIQVKAASVDIVDIRICAGYGRSLRRLFSPRNVNQRCGFPVTLGRDCSGIVIEIGQGVQKLDIGDEVWAVSPFWSAGTIAEFVVLPEELVARKPRSAGFEGAAALPYAGCLAYAACARAGIFESHVKPKRVLIQSGVSPVGCIACQLARNNGCDVTVTCSTRAAPLARALGASEVVVFDQMDFENQLTKQRFDVVLNTVGGVSNEACELLCKPDGMVVSTVPSPIPSDHYNQPLAFLHGLYLRTVAVFKRLSGKDNQWTETEFSAEVLDALGAFVDKGQVQPVVDKIFAPQDALLALQHCDSPDAMGKTIIRFRSKADYDPYS